MATERPILFSGPMVRAILDGRKTQTRRLLKHDGPSDVPPTSKFCDPGQEPWEETVDRGHWIGCNAEGTTIFARCPYGAPGDRLWVRECFTWIRGNGIRPWYQADGEPRDSEGRVLATRGGGARWSPSIHMPRKVSRITLEVTGVRVEQLHEITASDARAEGLKCPEHDFASGFCLGACPALAAEWTRLWDSINGKRAAWASNPWVWVVEFKRLDSATRAA